MKRIGVAAFCISGGMHNQHILLGRRGKEPNKGLYVLPGGGLQEGESLEAALQREIMEETGLELWPRSVRWSDHVRIFELSDRLILMVQAEVKCRPTESGPWDDTPRDGDDLYEVQWFPVNELPKDISPVCVKMLRAAGYHLLDYPHD